MMYFELLYIYISDCAPPFGIPGSTPASGSYFFTIHTTEFENADQKTHRVECDYRITSNYGQSHTNSDTI